MYFCYDRWRPPLGRCVTCTLRKKWSGPRSLRAKHALRFETNCWIAVMEDLVMIISSTYIKRNMVYVEWNLTNKDVSLLVEWKPKDWRVVLSLWNQDRGACFSPYSLCVVYKLIVENWTRILVAESCRRPPWDLHSRRHCWHQFGGLAI